ncbi:hypothetical protein Droror1_Dr00024695 [Drosera rotundifolia]
MGCCLSKKDPSLYNPPAPIPQIEPNKPDNLVARVENKKKVTAAMEAEPADKNKEEINNKKKKKEQQHVEKKSGDKEEEVGSEHRKSNGRRPEAKCSLDSNGSVPCGGPISPGPSPDNGSSKLGMGGVVRTSSCTKEEVDAILIQCGRLSRSSSRKGTTMSFENRSGKKRNSHDFDSDNVGGSEDRKTKCGDQLVVEDGRDDDEEDRRMRRESRGGSQRRRTPSRSRERDPQQQRSANRSGSGRRASRSPGRRSENYSGVANGGSASGNSRPGKMVSVPATVSSLSNENGSANGSGRDATANVSAKRIPVKRNVGEVGAVGSRGAASPRSQSPARANGGIKVVDESDNQQVPSLISSTSRKAEHSPHRRTPLDAIDMNSIPIQPLVSEAVVNNSLSKGQHKNKDSGEVLVAVKKHVNPASQSKCADTSTVKLASHATHRRTRSKGGEGNEVAKNNSSLVSNTLPTAVTQQSTQDKGEQPNSSAYDAVMTTVIMSGPDSLKLPQTLTRSRSYRRSRDLDIDAAAVLNPNTTSNYNSLLLEDIQNFLQSSDSNAYDDADASTNSNINTNTNICTPFTLPPCLSKACSILEAVADLNSSTSSNLSAGAFADEKHKSANNPSRRRDNSNFCFSANPAGKKRLEEEARDSLVVESEVNPGGDDLMAPSIHKYVTLRKKGIDDEEQESSGSNSFVGNQLNNWVPSCSWEPNSADSTDCFTSSRSNTRGKEGSGHLDVEKARNNEEPLRKISKIRRESSNKQQNGTKNARSGGAGKGRLHGVANPVKTISAST